ncbi:hypothetical protein NDU88_004135 [Pleurodeles waltl]|uniref:Uncharacterized protein n=1 Tax=Pleurodeles waltl TaxID=8319 RepID=A0AAV7MVK9_PLEWA|nr:hypothetical protein NDU88_004135 [Pleurodeles waltl]
MVAGVRAPTDQTPNAVESEEPGQWMPVMPVTPYTPALRFGGAGRPSLGLRLTKYRLPAAHPFLSSTGRLGAGVLHRWSADPACVQWHHWSERQGPRYPGASDNLHASLVLRSPAVAGAAGGPKAQVSRATWCDSKTTACHPPPIILQQWRGTLGELSPLSPLLADARGLRYLVLGCAWYIEGLGVAR